MRIAIAGLFAACGEPTPEPVPFAIVAKLDGYERHVAIDRDGHAAFAACEMTDGFGVTMTARNSPGGPDAVFVREYRGGDWYSSSPSPGVIVGDEPRIEPACNGCHDDFAEALGMFTLPA